MGGWVDGWTDGLTGMGMGMDVEGKWQDSWLAIGHQCSRLATFTAPSVRYRHRHRQPPPPLPFMFPHVSTHMHILGSAWPDRRIMTKTMIMTKMIMTTTTTKTSNGAAGLHLAGSVRLSRRTTSGSSGSRVPRNDSSVAPMLRGIGRCWMAQLMAMGRCWMAQLMAMGRCWMAAPIRRI